MERGVEMVVELEMDGSLVERAGEKRKKEKKEKKNRQAGEKGRQACSLT